MTFLEAVISCYVRPQRKFDKIKWYQDNCRFYMDEIKTIASILLDGIDADYLTMPDPADWGFEKKESIK